MRLRRPHVLLVALGILASCTEAGDPTAIEAPDLVVAADHTEGLYRVRGSGTYVIALASGTELETRFNLNSRQVAEAGAARGRFRHRLLFGGELVDFTGAVTCMTVDPETGRAWIGGVVHKNRSVAEPFASGEIYQPGAEIWFRVLDTGRHGDEKDRSTFTGFEGGGGFITSAEYCEARPWPEENARTNPVVEGRIAIKER